MYDFLTLIIFLIFFFEALRLYLGPTHNFVAYSM